MLHTYLAHNDDEDGVTEKTPSDGLTTQSRTTAPMLAERHRRLRRLRCTRGRSDISALLSLRRPELFEAVQVVSTRCIGKSRRV